MTREQIKRKIDELQKELKSVEDRQKFISENPEYELAEALHDNLCHANHTDGCGWCYNDWNDPGSERKEALAKAREVLKVCDLAQALKVVDIIGGKRSYGLF